MSHLPKIEVDIPYDDESTVDRSIDELQARGASKYRTRIVFGSQNEFVIQLARVLSTYKSLDPTDVDRLAGSKHVCCNIKGLTRQDQVDAYLQFVGESEQPQFAMEHVNIREGPAGTGKSYTAVLGDVGVMRELHGSFLTTNTNALVITHKSKIFHHGGVTDGNPTISPSTLTSEYAA
ncbi:hypothetical protein SARC_07543 [Sphaeroforma arctica JP610]|uniref:Uncharacterized protein n=1 Tax=Sphaeroforma arctica JP610 TaxID=667725 RepID=A0A0L0FTH0_9EUKA|nr:hypothetical protein SARC_07543 [Sphaeroforma arctica JP610]KNC80100.1 hypothetical protein SARC_07543 [Sphaeroforma arctica JP610]|eukprot:XP_014154002.1 hypothetical protein SARC_07543 [Sphaeroforma arctica JP610]